jgi:hypothetical protein
MAKNKKIIVQGNEINIIEYLNTDFKGNEFVTFKTQVGLNSFNLTPHKWIEPLGNGVKNYIIAENIINLILITPNSRE